MKIGDKINHWTIIDTAPSRNNQTCWLCKCDCGNERIVRSNDLINNKSKSCGCVKSPSPRLKDETGKIYGRLTVLSRAENTKAGKAQWLCQCECGNQVIVKGECLRSGKTKSCGCYHRDRTSEASTINLIGQTIGNFTILEGIMGQKNGSHHSWRCRCNLCGNENAIISTSNLKQQYSCGCAIRSKGAEKIKQILVDNHISFTTEKRFQDCKFGEKHQTEARFDFYLLDYNCLIEYDGVQHFKPGTGHFDNLEKFLITQEHDNIKNQYAKKHNISLIRIPYTHYNNITLEDLLPNTSSFII